MRQYVEFAHAIGVAMRNNCPTIEWHSWKYVSENVKKAVMDQLLVSVANVENN
ncbi:serine hydroxymethyltransferase 7-like [Pyrus ussuriensis x Pyrus communis]|uniref:Serine hydroxymethyltransferase 7-like n=1 Tax=Pyrus ussuriensis x Pyrus communis TaxID=2448454 RepID=A0A5N5G5C0_9ROSA|nr:serine hydroxymethyltransferase 7-like [Pyrus ussuriensis x Pyrus communis]